MADACVVEGNFGAWVEFCAVQLPEEAVYFFLTSVSLEGYFKEPFLGL